MRALLATFILLNIFVSAHADEASQALLQKIQAASQETNYLGIFVFQHENQLISSRIAHSFEHGDEQEKIEKLDGRKREYVRHNDDIFSYQPDTKTLRTEKRQAQNMFPAVLAFSSPNLNDHYQFRLADNARVAGVDCRMIIIEPKDALRYGYHLCAALVNNLMLQAQTVDLNNQVLEQIAFTSLTFGHIDQSNLKTDFPDTSDWKTVHSAVVAATESGWTVKKLPAGFKKMREVRRLISTNYETSTNTKLTDLHEVLQMVFSDGLASISIFIEPLNQNHRAGVMQRGATTVSSFQLGNFWVTLVGEVPIATIKLLADSIEYKAK